MNIKTKLNTMMAEFRLAYRLARAGLDRNEIITEEDGTYVIVDTNSTEMK